MTDVLSSLGIGLPLITLGSCAHVYMTFSEVWERVRDDPLKKDKAVASFLRTISAVIWPVCLLLSVHREERCHPILLLPLVLHSLFWYIDAHLMHQSNSNNKDTPASLRIEPSTLTGLGFALSGLSGSRPDSKYSYLFLYSIVGCFLVVLPSHNLATDSIEKLVFESIQKAFLLWCVCLVVTAVILTRTCQNIQDRARGRG